MGEESPAMADGDKQEIIDAHNALRALHECPPLEWSDDCAKDAQTAADNCATKGEMYHNTHDDQGQNIFWSSNPLELAAAVQAWYDELTNPGYDYSDPENSPGTGHFTQVIWKGTTHVGFGRSSDGNYICCNYTPAGNCLGQYDENVPPVVGEPEEAAAEEEVEEVEETAGGESVEGIKVLQALNIGLMVHQPKDPKAFMIERLEAEGGPLAKRHADLEQLYCMFDPVGLGRITQAQFKCALQALGVSAKEHDDVPAQISKEEFAPSLEAFLEC